MRVARSLVAALLVASVVTGCTTTLSPTGTSTPDTSSTSEPTLETPVTSSPTTSEPAPSEPESTASETPAQPASSSEPAPTATSYTPPADPEAVDGDCPYLSKDEVQSATGQRMGQPQLRAAEPQPTCEFVRNDDTYLATVRVLQFATDAQAVSAVDFYAPREASNPESKPTGWSGGSIPSDTGSIVAVSKGGWAVIAQTNLPTTVGARVLVTHAIENLGL